MSTTTDAVTPRFESTWESLQHYKCPEWFRDAKFGIWAHWGPQGVPMIGDWYARNMYMQGHPHYEHHCRVYGHPSKFGYKDLLDLWKAENFDADALVGLYKRIGAKYFMTCAAHHDNFDCWNSKHHKWNAVNMGPKKDIVGLFAEAAKKAGLKFGVTDHLERAYSWFNTNKGADLTGPYAGVPYDGNDPEYADFYFEPHSEHSSCYPQTAPESWMRHWQARMQDVIDQYDPDVFYTDGAVPFGEIGLELMAEFYNRNIERRGGKLEAVYALKDHEHLKDYGYHGEYREGVGVLDVERGVTDGIHVNPWQTDTCVGEWYYKAQTTYKTPTEIITMLIDIVSKNGNLLLNFPVRPDGTLDEEELWIAEQIGQWMDLNSEGIYETRPWEVFGEGPTRLDAGLFAEREKKAFTAKDFRFTQKGNTLYVYCLGWPENGVLNISSLRHGHGPETIRGVELVGHGPVPYMRTARDWEGLAVNLPKEAPCAHAWLLKVSI
jgi:alpha-L-fucosidase